MKKKRIIVVGPAHCGKTTLVNELNDYVGPLRKTQDTIYGKNTIDVPGSFVEVPWMYKHLIALAQDASHLLLLVDQANPTEVYSPGFGRVFKCPVIGVVARCDLKPENEELCLKQLKQIGVSEPYFRISISNGTGIEELKSYLFNKKLK